MYSFVVSIKPILYINDINVVNGLIYKNRQFDSKLTFYRGSVASHIDYCMTNDIDSIKKFTILEKSPQCDQCPCVLKINISQNYPFEFINDYANGTFSYRHYDVNFKLKNAPKLQNCNLLNVTADLEKLSDIIQRKIDTLSPSKKSINDLCSDVSSGIFDCCKNNSRKMIKTIVPQKYKNCDSKNFEAIAVANKAQYGRCIQIAHPRAEFYKKEWLEYQNLAWLKENEEIMNQKSFRWHHHKKDPQKIWDLLDWKGHDHKEKMKISPSIIHSYFDKVFNSPKTLNNPVVHETLPRIENYNVPSDVTDVNISITDLEYALKKVGTGISYDGI